MVSSYASTTAPPVAPGNDLSAPPGAPGAGAPPPDRSLGRRSSLPAGRAVVGATLVITAAVLSFVGYLTATAKPTQTYYVAARDIRALEPVAVGDFQPVSGDLPADAAANALTSLKDLDGAVATTNLKAHDLALRSSVARRDAAATSPYELRFTAPAVKVDGFQRPDVVNLVAVEDGARGALLSVTGVQLLNVERSPVSSNERVVTVAATDQAQSEAIVKVVKGEFWIVRVNGGANRPTAPTTSAPAWGELATTTSAATFPSLPPPPTTAAPRSTARP